MSQKIDQDLIKNQNLSRNQVMSHGGSRTGAGRKKGSSNKISAKAVIEKISAEDMKSPLEIMTHIMHQAFAEGDFEMALDAAHKAAPYMHAKLSESKLEHTSPDHSMSGAGPLVIEIVKPCQDKE